MCKYRTKTYHSDTKLVSNKHKKRMARTKKRAKSLHGEGVVINARVALKAA